MTQYIQINEIYNIIRESAEDYGYTQHLWTKKTLPGYPQYMVVFPKESKEELFARAAHSFGVKLDTDVRPDFYGNNARFCYVFVCDDDKYENYKLFSEIVEQVLKANKIARARQR